MSLTQTRLRPGSAPGRGDDTVFRTAQEEYHGRKLETVTASAASGTTPGRGFIASELRDAAGFLVSYADQIEDEDDDGSLSRLDMVVITSAFHIASLMREFGEAQS